MPSQPCFRALVALTLFGAALGFDSAGAEVSFQPYSPDRWLSAQARANTHGEDEEYEFDSWASQELGAFDHDFHVPVATSGASAHGAATQFSFQEATLIYADGSISIEAVNSDGESFVEAGATTSYSMFFTTDATTEVSYSLTGWISGSAGIVGSLRLSDHTGTLHYYDFEDGSGSVDLDLSGPVLPGRSYRLVIYLQAGANIDPLTEPSASISGSFQVELTLPEVTSAPIAAGTFPRLQVWPNPFAGRSSISVEGASFTGEMLVYDVRGRLVQKFRMLPEQQVLWDGRDRDGRSLPPGVYFLRLDGAGIGDVSKVTLLR